jgi:hypothetical protein
MFVVRKVSTGKLKMNTYKLKIETLCLFLLLGKEKFDFNLIDVFAICPNGFKIDNK